MNSAIVQKAIAAMVGGDTPQRATVRQQLLGAACAFGFAGTMAAAAWLELLSPWTAFALGAWMAGGAMVFYALARGGESPMPGGLQLGQAHAVFVVMSMMLIYLAAGPVRAVALAFMVMSLGVSLRGLPARHVRGVSSIAVLLLGVVMACGASLDPARYPPQAELLHFVALALAMAPVAWLAHEHRALQETLRQRQNQLEAAQSHNRLLTTQDELTSLSNRRHMVSLMTAERIRQQRSRQPISMVLIDIDHFKRINEDHGHAAGDQVLQIFADVMTYGLRAGDSLSRWGGEEFLMMLPHTTAEEALACVERVRHQLAARSFDHVAPRLGVTFSAGIGVCGAHDRLETVIERAEHAMHRAKSDGRNRTIVA